MEISWKRVCPYYKAGQDEVARGNVDRPALVRTYHCRKCHRSFGGIRIALVIQYVRISWKQPTLDLLNRDDECEMCDPAYTQKSHAA